MQKVFIVNNSTHNFEAAKKFGDIIFLSEGPMNRYATNNMFRQFGERLKDSTPDDYIVPCALNMMNTIAACLFAVKHHKLNLLLFKDGEYIERNHVFSDEFMG
jgi:hypothetical protein